MDSTTILVALIGFAGVFATAFYSQRSSKKAAEAEIVAAEVDRRVEENAHELAVAKQQTEGWLAVNAELRMELDRVNAQLTLEREARITDRQAHLVEKAAWRIETQELREQLEAERRRK